MEQFITFLNRAFPDALFYLLTGIVFLMGVCKCVRPVLRNAGILRRATETLREGAKAKLARPLWAEPGFLGKRLQPAWRAFLQSADMMRERGAPVDVADYINEENIITLPGRAALADIIPGLCTSIGILGTFVGLSIGLDGLDLMDMDSYVSLTGGIALAFNTSIVGLIASLLFNVLNKYAAGRARDALDAFTAAFYATALPQPPDTPSQILALERDQTDMMSQFTQEMSTRVAGEIHQAVASAMAPVQRTMDDFINAATRAQIDGLDYIVARFIDRMNSSLDGQFKHLGETLETASQGQAQMQENQRSMLESVSAITRDVTNIHGVAEDIIAKFAGFVGDMETATQRIAKTQEGTADLLEEMNEASRKQARYLSALQEYQAKLQGSFQDYTVWTDKFVSGLEESTNAQSESLEQVAMEMRASADLLRGAYKTFVESIEVGLANALGLFDENMQNLTRQIHSTLSDIQETMVSLEETIGRAAGPARSDDASKEVS